MASNPFLAFLAEHGVNLSEQKAITGETGRRGNRMVPYFGPIFRRAGLPLDVLAQYAHERGFLTDAQFNSDLDNGGVNALTEMIRRTQAGERIDSATSVSEESEFERRAQAYHDAHAEAVDTLDAEATDEELGALVLEVTDEDETATAAAIDAALGLGSQGEDRDGAQEAPAVATPLGDSGSRTPARSAGTAEVDEARAEREAIQAEAAGLESGIDLDEVNALLSEAADADRSIRDETLDRILREERGEEEAHARGAQGDDAGPQIRGSERDQADQGSEDVLSRPTEQGLKARADAALRRAKEKRERDAAPPPEEFTLAGSESPADQARASGQVELAPADAAAAQSPSSPSNNLPVPSEAQHDAGNYLKPPARINGLTVRIENEAGTHRRPEWPALPAHYGYIERSEGADGDGVDVFVKPGTPEDFDGPVFIIDQTKQGGGFDEHKTMLGWKTQFGAVRAYKRAYTRGWKVGPVTRMSMDEFKAWLREADTTKPASRQIAKKRADRPTKPTGAWTLAQRQQNAGERFIQAVTEQFGLTIEQAKAALAELVRLREVKLSAASGQFELRDGRFWNAEVMRRAAETNYQSKVDSAAADLSPQLVGEAAEDDFDASEVRPALDAWAKDAGVAADDLRQAVLKNVSKEDVPAAIKKKVRDALSPTKAARKGKKIVDVGGRIGGARKDLATSTGPKGTKPADERPGWRKRYTVSQIAASSKPGEVGRWTIHDERQKDRLGQARQVGRDTFATKEDAEAAIPLVEVARNHRATPVSVQAGGATAYEITRMVSDRKRVKVVDQQFATREDAMRYMAEHAVEIIETKTSFGEELLPAPEKVMREGPARREGDATGEQFKETFGFKAVEFGNWNSQDERQEVMNHAFDGLADLAEVLGIPTQAIGLNGELALAFGARGSGLTGARAHYEPDYSVINLTKMRGAGSLAHEWLHALDHYLGRQDGKASSERVKNQRGDVVFKTGTPERDMATHGFKYRDSGVRQEVRDAYNAVVETMLKKAEQYVEDTQKADKFVGSARGDVQKHLERIRESLATKITYRTRKNEPASAEQLAAFDEIARRIVDGEAIETKVMPSGKSGVRWSNDALEALSRILKDVRGHSGFAAGNKGTLDALRGGMDRYSQRLKMLAQAQSAEVKTKKVPTDYAMAAKSIDQGRASDYWSTPHEMAARAFQSYVLDKIAERGGTSDFLTYGAENLVVPTPWGWQRPFPAGAERKAINAAFDNLVATLQTRETGKGIAIYEPSERYSADEPQATYQFDLPLTGGGVAPSGRPGLPGAGNRPRRSAVQRVEAAPEVRLETTPDPAGVYLARTELVADRDRTIHANRVTTPQEAAVALASVADYAVEHFHGLVTDKAGKPLALVGMFKGSTASTSVPPETILAESFRVKGAANLWFSHNHPSGIAEFSRADKTLFIALQTILQGTGIEPRGLFAQTYSKGTKSPGAWVFTDGHDNIRGQVLAADIEAANKVTVPVVERVIVKQESRSAIRSPADAKDAARAMLDALGTDAPFAMLLSSQNEPIGAYPLKPGELAVLREGERAANLLRATSVANASGSILVDVQAALTDAELNNVAGALSVATGARPLDALTGKNLAARTESGRWDPPHGTFFSRRQSTKADYESRIDELFSGEPANRIGAKVLDRSDLLALLGFGDKAMRLQESKVIAGRENHRLTAEHWKKVPEWLENPVAVFDSETVLGRLVFIAPEMLNGDPIIMIVEPDAEVGVVRVGLLVNAYDRQAAHTPIKRWLKAGLLRYLDESRSPTWGGTSGLRLPRVNRPSQGSKAIVRTNRDLVKFREGEGQTRFLRRVDAALRSVQDRSDETPADTERSRGDRQRNRIGRDALHRINEHLRAARAPDQDAVADLKDALRARGADPGIDALRASTVPDAARAIAGVLERLFGVKAIFVDGAENLTAENQFDGMYIGGRRVFISSSATKPFHQVIGHEFLHHLKRTNRDLYDEFVEAVQPFVLARRAQAYAQARGEEYSGLAEAVRTETGWEETFADAWGDAWNEPAFWRSLAASNQGLFKTIAAKWRLFVLSIRMALAGERGRALTKGLFTDFDAVRDVIADVAARAERAEGQSTVGQPMLRSPPQDSDAFVSEVLAELAQHDELFRYPTSKSTTLDGVMADVFPEAQYLGEDTRPDERQESGADARHVIRGANGKMAYIFERGKEVWLDISRFQEGDRGDGVYAAAMNYAHNAGKRFIGDPAGLSEAAIVRRTSAMLSNALRFGTTKHMDAAPEQIAGVPEKGIAPLKWQGDDLAKTTALIDSFLSTLYTQFPVLKGYRYDFRKGQFLDRSGRPVGPDRFAVAGRREVARRAKAGSATARRGIFLQSLVSSESGQRPELLEHILRRGRALTAEGGPARAMFSRRASAATRAGLGELSNKQEAALRNVGGIAAAKTLSERVHEIRANLKTKLVQGLVDQFAPLKDLDPRAYVLSRLSRGADGTLEAAMLFGKPFLNGGVADVKMDGGFAKTLSALEGEHDRFLWWVAAQRAERLKAIGLENLFGETDIATLKGLDRGTLASGKPRAAAFAKALDDLNAFNDAVLGIAEKSGLIDAETRTMPPKMRIAARKLYHQRWRCS